MNNLNKKHNLNQQNQKRNLRNLTQKKKRRKKRKLANLKLEQEILSQGYERIVGIDEVGRGAWAGPVVVGAFEYFPEQQEYNGVRDSKLLKIDERELLVQKLQLHPHIIEEGSVESINSQGLGKTIEELISNIVQTYDKKTFFLIDGQFAKNFTKRSLKVIKGDMKHYSIACASNLAKVYRDNLMKELHLAYPEFGFESNVGYPSLYHRQALETHGPTKIHRASFKPIAEMLNQYSLGISYE